MDYQVGDYVKLKGNPTKFRIKLIKDYMVYLESSKHKEAVAYLVDIEPWRKKK